MGIKITGNKIPKRRSRVLSAEDAEEFERGIRYFNDKKYRHACQAWELLSERNRVVDPRFLKSMIDISIAYRDLVKENKIQPALTRLTRAIAVLETFIPEYCGIHVESFVRLVGNDQRVLSENQNLGIPRRHPEISYHKPADPDISTELCEALRSRQFSEGMKLFNRGLYWEAHEEWKELWREQSGEGKIFIEAFVQLGEAYSFVQHGKNGQAVYLFEKAVKTLVQYKNMKCTLEVARLVKELGDHLELIRTVGSHGPNQVRFPKRPAITLSDF